MNRPKGKGKLHANCDCCKGKGIIKKYLFIKKLCPVCDGYGFEFFGG